MKLFVAIPDLGARPHFQTAAEAAREYPGQKVAVYKLVGHAETVSIVNITPVDENAE